MGPRCLPYPGIGRLPFVLFVGLARGGHHPQRSSPKAAEREETEEEEEKRGADDKEGHFHIRRKFQRRLDERLR